MFTSFGAIELVLLGFALAWLCLLVLLFIAPLMIWRRLTQLNRRVEVLICLAAHTANADEKEFVTCLKCRTKIPALGRRHLLCFACGAEYTV